MICKYLYCFQTLLQISPPPQTFMQILQIRNEWSMQWIWKFDNYHFMCFLLPLKMLCKNQAVHIFFSSFPFVLIT